MGMQSTSARSTVGLGLLMAVVVAGCADTSDEAPDEQQASSALDAPRCTGKPGRLRGVQHATVRVGFDDRTFVYYAPQSLDPNKPVPLVIVPHGFTMSGDTMFAGTGYREIADREGIVAIFPDGKGILPWNVGDGVNGWGAAVAGGHDDQSFVDAMLDYAKQDQCIDEQHVFMSGFSMGGYFSNEIGCTRDDFAAIGPHSGGSHDLTFCPGKKKPAIIFHGDTDPLIYYENGVETRDRWAKRNRCSAAVDRVPVKGGTCEYNKDCKDGQVALCHFDLMGHAWAGGNILGNVYSDPSKENAAELGWSFFKKYAW